MGLSSDIWNKMIAILFQGGVGSVVSLPKYWSCILSSPLTIEWALLLANESEGKPKLTNKSASLKQ